MLKVAEGVIAQLAAHRERSGIDLHGRIGIALGSTVSGVIGRLQPRFAVFGEAMSAAAELEQTGIRDAVHCSEDFLRCIRRRAPDATGGQAAPQHGAPGMQLQGMRQAQPLTPTSTGAEARSMAAAAPDASLQVGPASTASTLAAAACVHDGVVVERMLAAGKLLVQQNMMAAQPDTAAMATPRELCRDKPVSECEQFGLRTTLSREGNFVAVWFGDAQHTLRRSVDSNGMLTPLGHERPGVSATRNESNIHEEAKALCVGCGEGERSEIRGTKQSQVGGAT